MDFDPILMKLGYVFDINVELCFSGRGRATPIVGGATPQKQPFLGGSQIKNLSSPRELTEWNGFFGI